MSAAQEQAQSALQQLATCTQQLAAKQHEVEQANVAMQQHAANAAASQVGRWWCLCKPA